MKKVLLSIFSVLTLSAAVQAQVTHKLDISGLYNKIAAGITAGTESATISGTKILVNADRTEGIFTLISPSDRTFRMDVTEVTFDNGETVTARLETNGASNKTNGRKIYIDCPSAGTLKLGAYSTAADRGYLIEKADGTVLFNSEQKLTPVTNEDTVYPIYEYAISEAGQIVVNPNAGIYYGLVEFTVNDLNGVSNDTAEKGEVIATEYYDITGRKVAENTVGLILKKLTYEDGSTEVLKTIVRQ